MAPVLLLVLWFHSFSNEGQIGRKIDVRKWSQLSIKLLASPDLMPQCKINQKIDPFINPSNDQNNNIIPGGNLSNILVPKIRVRFLIRLQSDIVD